MSEPSRVKILRAWRAGLAIFLAGVLALDAAGWIASGRVVIWDLAVLVFTASALGFLTHVINRGRRLSRPRPDYSAIAAMEREVYGETFEHDGAPERAPALFPPTMPPAGAPPRPKQSGHGTITVIHTTGSAQTGAFGGGAGGSGSNETTCPHGHPDLLWVDNAERRGLMCPQCARQETRCDCDEHRSNLRWERPS